MQNCEVANAGGRCGFELPGRGSGGCTSRRRITAAAAEANQQITATARYGDSPAVTYVRAACPLRRHHAARGTLSTRAAVQNLPTLYPSGQYVSGSLRVNQCLTRSPNSSKAVCSGEDADAGQV